MANIPTNNARMEDLFTDCVAYYDFKKDAKDLVGGNDGTLTTTTISGTDYLNITKGATFPGTSGNDIDCGTGIDFNTTGWTIAMAFKAPSVDRYRRLINVRTSSTPYLFIVLDSNAGGDDLRLQLNDTSSTGSINSTNSYDDDAWHFVVAKLVGTTIYMNTYDIDGVSEETLSSAYTQSNNITGQTTRFGDDPLGSNAQLEGQIAWCIIWDRGISDNEERLLIDLMSKRYIYPYG